MGTLAPTSSVGLHPDLKVQTSSPTNLAQQASIASDASATPETSKVNKSTHREISFRYLLRPILKKIQINIRKISDRNHFTLY